MKAELNSIHRETRIKHQDYKKDGEKGKKD